MNENGDDPSRTERSDRLFYLPRHDSVTISGHSERKIITKKSDFTENADRLQIRKVKKEK